MSRRPATSADRSRQPPATISPSPATSIPPRAQSPTTLAQNIKFSNVQNFTINGNTYEQDIAQGTMIGATTTVVDSAGTHIDNRNSNWPMTMDIVLNFNPDGSGTQTTTVSQDYSVQDEATLNGGVVAFSELNNQVTPTDTLEFNSSVQLTGNENQSSAQTYYTYDMTGYCYSKSLTAANNILTSITTGQGCAKK